MKCPHCGSDRIVVIEIKGSDYVNTRTYGCNNCGMKSVSVEEMKRAERQLEEENSSTKTDGNKPDKERTT